MARYKVDTITQMMRHGCCIRALCRYGNNTTINPEKLPAARKAGLSTSVHDLFRRLLCDLCKQRPSDVHVTLPVDG